MPKHTQKFYFRQPFLDNMALAKCSSDSYIWVMIMAFFKSQETQPVFQGTFSVLLFKPSIGKTQKVCTGKGGSCAHPTLPLALNLQMRAKGESGWNMPVPAYPRLEWWPESALGSRYKKWHITKLARVKWHQDSQTTARGSRRRAVVARWAWAHFSLCSTSMPAWPSPLLGVI